MSPARTLATRRFWTPRQWLLAGLLLVAGALAWWQLRPSLPTTDKPDEPIRRPNYIVTDFTAVETADSGQPIRRLSARRLDHYIDEKRSELTQPRLDLTPLDGPPWIARAKRGLVYDSGAQISLFDEVQIDRAGTAGERPAEMRTEQLDIWRNPAIAKTNQPVRINSDGDTVTAAGMTLWYKEPSRTVFEGRTRIRLAPD